MKKITLFVAALFATTMAFATAVKENNSTIENKTIAEFIAAEGVKCYLTGVVGEVKNNKYGNFNLTDTTGTIYVYGCLTAGNESGKFSTLGVEQGDTLTILAETYKLYNGTKEVVDAIYVSHVEGGNSGDATEITPLEYCQALYYGEWDEGQEWIIQLWPSYNDSYTYVQLDITNQSTSAIAGTYELDDYSGIWFSDTDSVFVESGTLTITCIGNGEYTIVAEFECENSKKYTVNTTVEVVGLKYDENNKLVDVDLTDETAVTAIRDIEVMSDVYARDGRIYAEEGARIYTILGLDVTTMNGQLNGVYVVKNGNKVAKVVVK